MIYKPFQSIKLSTLGMGAMRLPTNSQGQIDYTEAHKILDRAYAAGINYFDTAHVYNGGDSERCLGACMVKHPRESFYIATKYNVDAEPDYRGMFEKQLQRLQTDYIDFYLIHCLKDYNIDKYINGGAVDYFLEQKKLGRIKYLGFSTHADTATLARFADHTSWDFAQIQMNYYDWVYGSAAEEYKILADRNIPIMVMEPVRGGRLATLTPEVSQMLQQIHSDWSMASWALRFVKSYPQVQVILSGMSTMEQLEDNLATFSDPAGLSAEDHAAILKAGELFKKQIQVPCTGCCYCTAECPMQINIPEYLRVYNDYKVNGGWALNRLKDVTSDGSYMDCIGCGACTGHCPQDIDIPGIMAELKELAP